MTPRTRLPLLFLLPALALLGGCRAAPDVQDLGEAATLRYVGSSTVAVFVRSAEPFYGAARFELDTEPESAGGEQAILDGEADLAGIAQEPQASTLEAGVIATLIGRDAIAVIVNAKNPVLDLSRAELRRIFTGQVKNWRELGGPDLEIEPFVVGAGSATRRVFAEAVLEGAEYVGCQEAVPDRSMLDAVARSPGAIGQLSFSFLGPQSGVRAVAVNSEFPSPANFDYPIVRPLYLLWREGHPTARDFVTWARSSTGQRVLMRNFVGTGVLGSVRSNEEPAPTGSLSVRTPTYSFYDGGVQYFPHSPYEVLDRYGKLLRTVRNHRGENDETPTPVELPPGTYLIRTRRSGEAPAEFFVTIDAGKVTELDVVSLLDPTGPWARPRRTLFTSSGGPSPVKFYGDARLRAEGTYDRPGQKDDFRTRVRMRLGANYRVNEEFTVGVRAVTGDPDDPNSSQVTLGDAFDKFQLNLDRAFVRYRPVALEGAWGVFGKFNHSFKRNPVYGELVWDADVQPEGILLGRSWRDQGYHERVVVSVGAYSVLDTSNGADVYALVAQASGTSEVSADIEAQLSLAGYYYTDVNPSGSTDLIDDNEGNATAGNQFVSQFGILNPVLALEYLAGERPLVFSAEYIKNLRAEIGADQGWAAGISYGRPARKGEWRAYYQWQVIERDAIFTPFAQDDFTLRTNFRGHVAGVKYMLSDELSMRLWGFYTAVEDVDVFSLLGAGDQDPWRVRLDFDIKF